VKRHSPRQVVTWLALSAALLGSLLALAACGSSGGSSTGSSSSAAGGSTTADSSSTPTDGGTVAIGTGLDLIPASFFTGSEPSELMIGLVYNTLVTYPHDSIKPEPSLATSWKLAPDGKSLTLQLRHGVKFSNGTEFTAKDVEYSLKTVGEEKWLSQFLRTADAISGFKTAGSYSITLEFSHPLANIFDLLDVVPMMEPNAAAGFATGKEYVGTGPFKFESWTPNQKIVLAANPNYWGGKPHLEGVEIMVGLTPQTQVSELRAGQLQAIVSPERRDAQALESDSQFSVLTLEGTEQQQYLGMNVDNPALKNIKLREALAYAIDRNSIAEQIYGNELAQPGSLPWPSYSPAYSAKLNESYAYDLTKAKELVAEAGSVPTLSLQYGVIWPNEQVIAEKVQAELEEIGIHTKLEGLQGVPFGTALQGGKLGALWIMFHQFAQFTPGTLSTSAFPFNAEKNSSNFSSPEYTKAADDAWELTQPTGAEATKVYEGLNQSLLKNLFLTEILNFTPQIVTSSSLQGVSWGKISPELYLENAYLSQ
jgi:peptide/nickel transport system substrate-binding protein